MFSKLKKSQKGFTLIEMLVVIAIISILIGVGINTFTIAQKKARDTVRKTNIATIRKALIAYGLDHNGSYSALPDSSALTAPSGNFLPNYMASFPTFPAPYNSVEFYGSSGGFKLSIRLENEGDPDIANPASACPTAYAGPTTGVIHPYCVDQGQ